MITTPKMLGIVATAFLAGTFVASPELRAYAANTVFSTDIVDGQVMTADLANNAVTAAKIKDGEVKAAEIATDAVGAAELQGVTKLLFGKCVVNSSLGTFDVAAGSSISIPCAITGVDLDDRAIAQKNSGNECFTERDAKSFTGTKTGIFVDFVNECTTTQQFGTGSQISVIVFDK